MKHLWAISVSNILIQKGISLICPLRAFQISSVLQFKSQCCSVIAAPIQKSSNPPYY